MLSHANEDAKLAACHDFPGLCLLRFADYRYTPESYISIIKERFRAILETIVASIVVFLLHR